MNNVMKQWDACKAWVVVLMVESLEIWELGISTDQTGIEEVGKEGFVQVMGKPEDVDAKAFVLSQFELQEL